MKNKKNVYILILTLFIGFLMYGTAKYYNLSETEEKGANIEFDSITATMYYPVIGQCDKDPLLTASMRRINPRKASEHKWVALSRDLLKRWGGVFDYGDKIMIVGTKDKDGVYTIVDCMNKRFKNKIDILETKGTKPYKFKNVKIIGLNLVE
jgi:hypothetical protein